jgi:hypothetical protein
MIGNLKKIQHFLGTKQGRVSVFWASLCYRGKKIPVGVQSLVLSLSMELQTRVAKSIKDVFLVRIYVRTSLIRPCLISTYAIRRTNFFLLNFILYTIHGVHISIPYLSSNLACKPKASTSSRREFSILVVHNNIVWSSIYLRHDIIMMQKKVTNP